MKLLLEIAFATLIIIAISLFMYNNFIYKPKNCSKSQYSLDGKTCKDCTKLDLTKTGPIKTPCTLSSDTVFFPKILNCKDYAANGTCNECDSGYKPDSGDSVCILANCANADCTLFKIADNTVTNKDLSNLQNSVSTDWKKYFADDDYKYKFCGSSLGRANLPKDWKGARVDRSKGIGETYCKRDDNYPFATKKDTKCENSEECLFAYDKANKIIPCPDAAPDAAPNAATDSPESYECRVRDPNTNNDCIYCNDKPHPNKCNKLCWSDPNTEETKDSCYSDSTAMCHGDKRPNFRCCYNTKPVKIN